MSEQTWNLEGKVALITGASRGIGRAMAVRLAQAGVHVMAASKTTEPHPKLPGTLQDTVEACNAAGAEADFVKMDVRDEAQVEAAVAATVERFGRLDITIHNAGALWWKPIKDTPIRKFDLVMDVNARGAYALAYHALPHMKAAGGGHYIALGPPIMLEALSGKVAYLISKFGMTMVCMGIAEEHRADNIAAHALWPETAIETAATVNFGLGSAKHWYKSELVADATYELVRQPPAHRTGGAHLVLDVMREAGVDDFTSYRCDPDHEPPILTVTQLPRAGGQETAGGKVTE